MVNEEREKSLLTKKILSH